MKLDQVNATICGNYLALPAKYGEDNIVSFFIPIEFINTGKYDDLVIKPENFFGVDLKLILERVKSREQE